MSNAAALGQARLFRARVAARAAALDLALADPAFVREAADFARKAKPKGRDRALRLLRARIDPFARFEIARLWGPRPAAIWAQIVPDDDTGVVLQYLLIRPPGRLSRGVWNVSVNSHALTRYYERGGTALAAALYEANIAVLKGRLYRRPGGEDVLAPASPGVFLGHVEAGASGAASRGRMICSSKSAPCKSARIARSAIRTRLLATLPAASLEQWYAAHDDDEQLFSELCGLGLDELPPLRGRASMSTVGAGLVPRLTGACRERAIRPGTVADAD